MKEETGWKLIYADVFRPPPQATLLSVYAGTGVQLVIMAVLVLCFAALGFLSPANRGSLLSAALFFFVLMGVPAGYVSARFCKLVKEPNHFKATLLTALMFPGVCFGIFFLINLVAWSRQSSTAVPFGTLIVLMLLWCVCVCVCVRACGGRWKDVRYRPDAPRGIHPPGSASHYHSSFAGRFWASSARSLLSQLPPPPSRARFLGRPGICTR